MLRGGECTVYVCGSTFIPVMGHPEAREAIKRHTVSNLPKAKFQCSMTSANSHRDTLESTEPEGAADVSHSQY